MPKFKRILIPNQPTGTRIFPDLAVEIGLNESMLLLQLEFWISISGHEYDGQQWTYQSTRGMQKTFPYWSHTTINRTIKSLLDKDLIIDTREFNEKSYDKTRWFALNHTGLSKLKSIRIDDFEPFQATPPPPEPKAEPEPKATPQSTIEEDIPQSIKEACLLNRESLHLPNDTEFKKIVYEKLRDGETPDYIIRCIDYSREHSKKNLTKYVKDAIRHSWAPPAPPPDPQAEEREKLRQAEKQAEAEREKREAEELVERKRVDDQITALPEEQQAEIKAEAERRVIQNHGGKTPIGFNGHVRIVCREVFKERYSPPKHPDSS